MRILGIPGSLRRGSLNRKLLHAAVWELPPGCDLHLYEWLRWLPPYDEDEHTDSAPPAASTLRSAVAAADAVLIATPEYNHSIPGQLKNALDWLSRPVRSNPLTGKPVAVVGASMSRFGAVWAQAETRKVLSAIGAGTLPSGLAVPHANRAFTDNGRLTDPRLRADLGSLLRELVDPASEATREQDVDGDRRSA